MAVCMCMRAVFTHVSLCTILCMLDDIPCRVFVLREISGTTFQQREQTVGDGRCSSATLC
jgi:hypothetical protein